MNIKEFRNQYPQYDAVDDQTLAKKLHQKHYSQVPFKDFAGKFGVAYITPTEDVSQAAKDWNADVEGASPQARAEMQTIEANPWVDPTSIIGGAGAIGSKFGITTAAKALPGMIASEPFVGGAAEGVESVLEDAPGYIRTPATVATALAAGMLTGRVGKAGGSVAKSIKGGNVLDSSKTKVVRDMFQGRFSPGEVKTSPSAKPDVMAEEVSASMFRPEIPKEVRLHSNPIPELGKAWGKYVGEPVWDNLIMKRVPRLLEKVPGGGAVNRALIYGHRSDLPSPARFNNSLEGMKLGQQTGMDYAVDLGNRLQQLPEDIQLKVGDYLRGQDVGELGKSQGLADEAKDALYLLGEQAVDAGLLKEETFFKNAGRYLPRLYTSKEYKALASRWGVNPPTGMEMSRFKARKDIPKEIREQMGEILTPGYPVAKGIANLTNDIEFAKFAGGVAKNPKWAVAADAGDIPDSFKLLEGKKFGNLNGKYVHPEIHREFSHLRHESDKVEKYWKKALGAWKYGKVILSPKTHVRNVMSNSVLAHLGGMPMYEQPHWLAKSAREMARGGEAWAAAQRTGLLSSTYTNRELRGMFDEVASQLDGVKAGDIGDKIGAIGLTMNKVRGAGQKAAQVYEGAEQWFKLAKFLHNRSKGMDALTASKDAEKWLFNYGKLTRFQDRYKSSPLGAPFATFTFKALPRIAEAAVKTPWRFALPMSMIYGLNKYAQDYIGDTDEQAAAKRELNPEWMQGGQFNWPRVPITDDAGREYYLNLTYVLPWGDIAESGGVFGIPGGLMPFSQPGIKQAWEQAANYDMFWKQPIVKDEDVAGLTGTDRALVELKKRGAHIGQGLAPTPVMDIIKGKAALEGKPDYRGRVRPDGVVLADVFGGVKMYPVDYAERVVQEVSKADPKSGVYARVIKSQIKTLAVKAEAMRKMGKDPSDYEGQIQERIRQLRGLAEQMSTVGKTYQRTQ